MIITRTNLILGGIILILLGIIYWQSGDEIVTKTEIVYKSPEIKKDFKPQIPKEIKPEIKYIDTIIYRDRKEVTDETVPKELLNKFLDAQNNSTQTLALYQDAIRKRNFIDKWEDDDFIVELEAESFGKINKWKPTVTQKAKEIKIPVDIVTKPRFHYYGGVKLLSDDKFTKPNVEGSLYLQIPNKDIITVSVGSSIEQRYGVGYIFKFGK